MVLILFLTILVVYNYYQVSIYKVHSVGLESNKLSEDLCLCHISDFHSSRFIDLDSLTFDIACFKPDIVLLTGDILDGRARDIEDAIRLVDRLKTLEKPIYFVRGNHENKNPCRDDFLTALTDRKVKILYNQVDKISKDLSIAGVEFGLDKKTYRATVDNLDKDSYNIVLSHSPKYPLDYRTGVEDLILSGHTHGGQIRLPFFRFIVPGKKWFSRTAKGLYSLESGSLYVDSGLGNSFLGLRFLNRVQISNISIKVK